MRKIGLGLLAICMAGCSGPLPEAGRLPKLSDAVKASRERFDQDAGIVPVRHVRTNGSGLQDGPLHKPVSESMRRRPIQVQFSKSDSTLKDLFESLSANDIQIGFDWSRREALINASGNANGQPVSSGQLTASSTNGTGGANSGNGHCGTGTVASPPADNSASPSSSSSQTFGSSGPTSSGPTSNSTAAGNFGSKSKPTTKSPNGQKNGQQQPDCYPPDSILTRRLPFMNYKGTIGGLLDTLKTGTGIVSFQEGDTLFLTDYQEYALTTPQNEDVMNTLMSTLQELGAQDVVGSIDAGRIVYAAAPDKHDRYIGPFLRRAARNLATINIEVAVVSLSLNDTSAQGFDWSQFGAVASQRQQDIASAKNKLPANNGSTTSTGSGGTSGTSSTSSSTTSTSSSGAAATTSTGQPALQSQLMPTTTLNQTGGLADVASGSVTLGTTSLGKVFGVSTVGSVAGAYQFLSTFGHTNVTQHVDTSALSGHEVKFSSGEIIPYVKSVGTNTSSGSSSGGFSLGTAQTDSIHTGIEVTMTPRFESENELVTIDFNLTLSSLITMLQLSAGSQLGTLTQPETANQVLSDIIRVRAGQTVVLGGLQADNEAYSGNDPTAMRDPERDSQTSFGLRSQTISRNALFVILRPTVVVFEPEEGR